MEVSGVRLERKALDLVPAEATLRPLRDQIIVEPLEWNPSAIIAVAGDTRKPLRGTVLAVGPGKYPKRYNADRSKTWDSKVFRPTEVKVGDVVELGGLELGGYSFPEIMWGLKRCLIATEQDVCGIVNNG